MMMHLPLVTHPQRSGLLKGFCCGESCKVAGQSSSKHYIARVDVVDDDEYEDVFLQKVAIKVKDEDVSFLPYSQDQASFTRDDIIHKLPTNLCSHATLTIVKFPTD